MADDGDRRGLRLFFGAEPAAQRRLGAEQRKEIRGHDLDRDLFRLLPVAVVHLVEGQRRHVGEHGVLRAQILEIQMREREVARVALIGRRDHDQRSADR